MAQQTVRILDGNTFVVCDERGDVEASPTEPTGLFSFDTRFLSRWVLTIDGQKLNSLSIDDLQYFESRFFLVPGTGTVYIDAKLSVIRERAVGDGFHEELTILNHQDEPVDLGSGSTRPATSPTCSRSRTHSRRSESSTRGSPMAGCISDTHARHSCGRRSSRPRQRRTSTTAG